jgi:ribosomal protein S28E/S33
VPSHFREGRHGKVTVNRVMGMERRSLPVIERNIAGGIYEADRTADCVNHGDIVRLLKTGRNARFYSDLSHVWEFVSAQAQGEDGHLNIDGWPNVAYVLNRNSETICVVFEFDGRGWRFCFIDPVSQDSTSGQNPSIVQGSMVIWKVKSVGELSGPSAMLLAGYG